MASGDSSHRSTLPVADTAPDHVVDRDHVSHPEVGDGEGKDGRYKIGVRSGMLSKAKKIGHAMNLRSRSKVDEDLNDGTEDTKSNTTKSSISATSSEKKKGIQNRILDQVTSLFDLMMKKTKSKKTTKSEATTDELSDISSMTGSEVVQRYLDSNPEQNKGKSKSLDPPVQIMSNSHSRDNPHSYDLPNSHSRDIPHSHVRPKIMPDKFDGHSDWNDYISHFESCRLLNSWQDKEAAQYLAASLRGPALRLLNEQNGTCWTYAEMKSKLALRFSSAKQAETYLLEVRNRKRGPNETLQELGRNIRELTVKAYPNFDSSGIDRLAKIHFIDAIHNSEIRAGILHARATTLDEVVHAAITTETFLQTEAQRTGWRKNSQNRTLVPEAMGAKSNHLEIQQEIETAVERAVKRALDTQFPTPHFPYNTKAQQFQPKQQPKRNSDAQLPNPHFPHNSEAQNFQQPNRHPNQPPPQPNLCFYCGKAGHFARDCRKKQSDRNMHDPRRGTYQNQSNEMWLPQRVVARPEIQ